MTFFSSYLIVDLLIYFQHTKQQKIRTQKKLKRAEFFKIGRTKVFWAKKCDKNRKDGFAIKICFFFTSFSHHQINPKRNALWIVNFTNCTKITIWLFLFGCFLLFGVACGWNKDPQCCYSRILICFSIFSSFRIIFFYLSGLFSNDDILWCASTRFWPKETN